MRFLSVCSGIEAASVAWKPLGWRALAFAEIEAFPRAVLAHHYPDTPCHGDFTALRDEPWIVDADMLVGGTPCHAFSVAGLRGSLSDDRGNLSLEFIRLADAIDDLRRAAGREPAHVLWENVPGVLSVSDNAFGAFLGGLVGSDEPLVPPDRWPDAGVVAGPKRVAAWRILDAQFFGVAQRRRRVFVLARGGAGAWRCADALLPIIDSLSGHPAPRREAGKAAPTIPSRSTGGGGLGTDFDCDGGLIQAYGGGNTSGPVPVAAALAAHGRRQDFEVETFIAHTLKGEGFDASEDGTGRGTGRGTPIVPVAFSITPSNSNKDYNAREVDKAQALTAGGNRPSARGGDLIAFDTTQISSAANYSNPKAGDPCHPLAAGAHAPAVAFALRGREGGAMPEVGGDRVGALRSASGGSSRDYVAGTVRSHTRPGSNEIGSIVHTSAVRRLTPVECARLQGFPDDYLTQVPWRGKPTPPDGPQYKALGNSFAVPVVRWIGERIEAVEQITQQARALAAEAELSKALAAIPGVRFMDPPDGGDPTLSEQVHRMADALRAAEAQVERMSRMLRQWREDATTACNLLAERTQGNPARSPAHNARLLLEGTIAKADLAALQEPRS